MQKTSSDKEKKNHPEGMRTKTLRSGFFISVQKGRRLSTSSILNDQIILSLVHGLGNVCKD